MCGGLTATPECEDGCMDPSVSCLPACALALCGAAYPCSFTFLCPCFDERRCTIFPLEPPCVGKHMAVNFLARAPADEEQLHCAFVEAALAMADLTLHGGPVMALARRSCSWCCSGATGLNRAEMHHLVHLRGLLLRLGVRARPPRCIILGR